MACQAANTLNTAMTKAPAPMRIKITLSITDRVLKNDRGLAEDWGVCWPECWDASWPEVVEEIALMGIAGDDIVPGSIFEGNESKKYS